MSTIIKKTPAGKDHQVVSVIADKSAYMKKPCLDCPWKKSAVGEFPAEAFRVSAHTSYDRSMKKFSCHTAGVKNPKTCAGFLLNGARDNFSVRIGIIDKKINMSFVTSGGHELFANYKEMAVANGVAEDEKCLELSRTD